MKKKTFLLGFIALWCGLSMLSAQVTIGADNAPQPFSVLELISGNDKGLRLPQLTQLQRDTLDGTTASAGGSASMIASATAFATGKTNTAMGLTIFNLDNLCVETWNGSTWIAQCMDCSGVTYPALGSSYNFCTGAKVSDLTSAAGGNVSWYDALTSGNKYASTAALTDGATYYAEQGLGNCKSVAARTPVAVTLGSCSSAPTGGAITATTNVMYDFQHQRLMAYNSGGVATDFQWQVSTDNSTFTPIAGAPNSPSYTIPANFAHAYKDAYNTNSDTLYFRCVMSNPKGSVNANFGSTGMLFINTTVNGQATAFLPGYGELNGVKYATLQRGVGGTAAAGTMNIALLNLGQSENGDAADLGDMYQWGRVADGHEHINWTKAASATYATYTSGSGGTSAVVSRDASQVYTAEGQIPNNADGTGYYGNFITNSGDWGSQDTPSNSRWGDGTKSSSTRASDIPLSGWTYSQNNPCPSGWRVPSRWNFWDIYKGTGTDTSISSSNYDGTDNTWSWRGATNNAIGGALLKNPSNGVFVFLPASGYRNDSNGAILNIDTHGYYWSSTYYNTNSSYALYFTNGNVNAGGGYSYKSYGRSIRCAAEY
jgi:uncharacterized protein (TIGR02145 family)